MEESVTYQALIRRGRESGLKEGFEQGRAGGQIELILSMGRKKFGKDPTTKQRAALVAITDVNRLEALGEKLLDVSTWAELLKPD